MPVEAEDKPLRFCSLRKAEICIEELIKRVKSALGSCGKIWERGSISRPLEIQYPRVWDHVMNRARRREPFI